MTTLQPTGLFRHQVSRETDKAVCLTTNECVGGGTQYGRYREQSVWFPKARIEWRTTVYGDELCAPAWIIRQKL